LLAKKVGLTRARSVRQPASRFDVILSLNWRTFERRQLHRATMRFGKA
jgi:hypothetical protein